VKLVFSSHALRELTAIGDYIAEAMLFPDGGD